jgi:hypothetical protein
VKLRGRETKARGAGGRQRIAAVVAEAETVREVVKGNPKFNVVQQLLQKQKRIESW